MSLISKPLAILFFCLLLIGCGQKGDLYLPETSQVFTATLSRG
ncbi:lipoprotein-attachment site-containing protein [Marinospirillum celere]|uniref:Lipoprotein-attachment site-containing protein n=1 Tax=Marinospirillum celere TaxID=1122252 RepID=A0A1I1I1V8_9GAMM|nr:lipoprotein [Marinospirillum celere]SFC30429.1 lipoprotein-attachment site-containing protein [Marinospirillum celere]